MELRWHIVCGQWELEDLLAMEVIKPRRYATERHQLFDQIRDPDHDYYTGPWGPELLRFQRACEDVLMGPVGTVYCTQPRLAEIHKSFIHHYNNHYNKGRKDATRRQQTRS